MRDGKVVAQRRTPRPTLRNWPVLLGRECCCGLKRRRLIPGSRTRGSRPAARRWIRSRKRDSSVAKRLSMFRSGASRRDRRNRRVEGNGQTELLRFSRTATSGQRHDSFKGKNCAGPGATTEGARSHVTEDRHRGTPSQFRSCGQYDSRTLRPPIARQVSAFDERAIATKTDQ
jgi:hypothetical protein